jgi:hypothetical protein
MMVVLAPGRVGYHIKTRYRGTLSQVLSAEFSDNKPRSAEEQPELSMLYL